VFYLVTSNVYTDHNSSLHRIDLRNWKAGNPKSSIWSEACEFVCRRIVALTWVPIYCPEPQIDWSGQ
jgi:hypothetical protein